MCKEFNPISSKWTSVDESKDFIKYQSYPYAAFFYDQDCPNNVNIDLHDRTNYFTGEVYKLSNQWVCAKTGYPVEIHYFLHREYVEPPKPQPKES